MNILELAQAIKHLDYVVQRNWEDDPYKEGDLDLFVSLEHYNELDSIILNAHLPFKVDIRTHGDNYYPDEICDQLLHNPREWNDWKIPSLKAHYNSLMYHSLVHKSDHPYEHTLRNLFLEIYQPIKALDGGVGFYV